jgi:phosphoribosylformylglycinamidine cyclo-ligase
MSISYKQSGVSYNVLDPFKRLAQQAAGKTASQLHTFGMKEVSASRGESAYVWEESDCYRALVIEGLGTKNLVADEMRKVTAKTYYDAIAQDTVAMIVNDLIVVGAKPQVVNAYFAVGDSQWFSDTLRTNDLVRGWAAACREAGASWGGGETPTLKDIVHPETIDLAGSAVGIIKPKKNLTLGNRLTAGDQIVLIESSGIHANGLTLARAVAKKLPKGYKTQLSDGIMYGEAILKPTHIYAAFVADLYKNGIDIHYMVNITGHGFRKLMRAKQNFSYVVETIPPPQPIFTCIQMYSGVDDKEMFGTFNMGAGFAVYVPEFQVSRVRKIAQKYQLQSWHAGYIKRGTKKVLIAPLQVTYSSSEMRLR